MIARLIQHLIEDAPAWEGYFDLFAGLPDNY